MQKVLRTKTPNSCRDAKRNGMIQDCAFITEVQTCELYSLRGENETVAWAFYLNFRKMGGLPPLNASTPLPHPLSPLFLDNVPNS
jgi:hypothetical protein